MPSGHTTKPLRPIRAATDWRARAEAAEAECDQLREALGEAAVLSEVAAERRRQDAKWGEQNHPNGTGSKRQILQASAARQRCDNAFADGTGTWQHILGEEVAEAFAEDGKALRAELIQVAAVAVGWVEAIDRRATDEEVGQ